jgi:hypothetical protein
MVLPITLAKMVSVPFFPGKALVAASKVEQGLTRESRQRSQDLANENAMVPCLQALDDPAFHPTDCAFYPWNIADRTGQPWDSFKAALRNEGEAVGDILLALFKKTQAEMRCGFEQRQESAGVVHADQHERGLGGDGRKGIDRQAMRIAVRIENRENAYAGGKPGANCTEILWHRLRFS